MRKLSWILIICIIFYMASCLAYADTGTKEDTTKEKKEVKAKYIGSTACKPCHNTEKKGKTYDKWSATKHATAYSTLASEEAAKIAEDMKIEDPQKSDKCLKCHATGYDATEELKGKKYDMTEGVSCEGCHGAGELYKSMKIMKDLKLSEENGLIMPTEETCGGCHNEESPTFKEFKFEENKKLIDHSYPQKSE